MKILIQNVDIKWNSVSNAFPRQPTNTVRIQIGISKIKSSNKQDKRVVTRQDFFSGRETYKIKYWLLQP